MAHRVEWLLCVAAIAGYPPCAASQQASPDHQYTSRAYGWSVSYPPGWEVDSLDPEFVRIQQPSTLPFGVVGIHTAVGVKVGSLDELADRWMAVEQERVGFQVLSRRPTALADGTRALELVNVLGTGTVGKSRKIFVLIGERGFLINAETYLDSFPTLEPYFDRIIKSFTVRNPVNQAFAADVVDDPPTPVSQKAPPYPPSARASGLGGRVTFRIIIDTLGVPEPESFAVVSSPREDFSEAVRAVLPFWRFSPARIHGERVRVLIEQWIDFAVK